jgi:DNA-directed RNA polymerase specialized sigma24 family protein
MTVADRDQLERGLRQLSLDHRVVLVLRFLMGMSPEQVAEALGVTFAAATSSAVRRHGPSATHA